MGSTLNISSELNTVNTSGVSALKNWSSRPNCSLNILSGLNTMNTGGVNAFGPPDRIAL